MEAPLPPDEIERLGVLHALEILDTSQEERFDRITRIVCRVLDVPISAVSLVDESRQWFKAIHGIEVRETPRSQAFCAHAILDDEIMVVPNALQDVRFADNPLVMGQPKIRSYAGQPLYCRNKKIGTLCAISTEPREFSEEQLGLLRDLAHVVETELDTRLFARAAIDDALRATIGAMASTMEMRDPYTAGHESRCAEIALAVGRELGWTKYRLEGLWLGAVVHDIGKISVPTEILTKPTPLTRGERMLIQEHPETGFTILKGVHFPWPIAEMVRQHHEKVDGSGYPRGLRGDQILLDAQVLSVADIMESMGTARPYRKQLGLEVALAEVERLAGSKLDLQVANACLRIFREKGFVLPQSP